MPVSPRLKPNLFLAGFLILLSAPLEAFSVSLTPSSPAPGLVGGMITWSGATDAPAAQRVRYRYRARRLGSNFQMIRDYGPQSNLDWTAPQREGAYEVEVSAKNLDTGEVATTSVVYQMNSRVNADNAVVSPTSNPQVFLFSAPACAASGRMRIDFRASDGVVNSTPFKACRDGISMNFYLAGMKAQTDYLAHSFLDTGSSFITGSDIPFTTGAAPSMSYTNTVQTAPPAGVSNQVLLTSNGIATDLAGNLLWSMPLVSIITRPEPGGYFWGILENAGQDISTQVIRKFDLVGMTVLETNAERVNEQLKVLGKRLISGFHHEVRTLPDGRIAALADVEQLLTNQQGPGWIDVLGDMIVVFDRDLNVVWTWDTFDWLDVNRPAVLGEVCTNGGGGCPPYYNAANANDWTHGNALQQTPDGQFLYSSRHQDWLIKIDYGNGEGDGHVIWRLGNGGDFTWNSSDPWPWFSHQHDGNFEFSDPNRLLVFDDGNTRFAQTGVGMSRGQVLELDENNRTVSFVLNAGMGVFSAAVGSAQTLRNGNYHFDAGYVIQPDNSLAGYSIEVSPAGAIVYQIKQNTLIYRSFRMTDLYTPN
jgi:hypothetical protein